MYIFHFSVLRVICSKIVVGGVFWQLSKNHCVAKAICESFRDSYLLAIFIQ